MLLAAGAWWLGLFPPLSPPDWRPVSTAFPVCGKGQSAQGCVVDGDTLIIGFGKERRRIRLTGYDAPELEGACEAERQLARKARASLSAWLSHGPFEWDGGDAAPYDQYGRELRAASRVRADGAREYLAETMIANGLASDSGWGASVDWCD